MKIRSAVPENGCLVYYYFVTDEKKNKNKTKTKQKKTSVKHIRFRLIGGCVNNTHISVHSVKHNYQYYMWPTGTIVSHITVANKRLS